MLRRCFVAARSIVPTIAVAVSLMLATARDLSAQAAQDPRLAMRARAAEAMKPIAWLAGEWEGPATMEYAPGQKITVTQREIVQSAAFGTALLVQGRGTMRMGEREQVVFESAAVISYDAPSREFIIAASGGSGHAGKFDIEVKGSNITWGFAMSPTERVRYEISLTPDGKWKELGFVSHDGGKTWTQNLEMLLTRK